MLAPVLARLEEIPGVVRASVECSGTHLLVAATDAAALARALPAVREALGTTAEVVEGAARDDQLAALARGELWFTAATIRSLSYVEGRILATRMADAIHAAVELDAVAVECVAQACRLEIFAALDHAHDTGGRRRSGWFWEAWPGIVDRISGRLEGVLGADARAGVEDALREQAPSR